MHNFLSLHLAWSSILAMHPLSPWNRVSLSRADAVVQGCKQGTKSNQEYTILARALVNDSGYGTMSIPNISTHSFWQIF